MTITAIIVTYNSAHVVGTALACLYEHPKIVECVVVDNASEDDTVALIREQFPRVRVIQNQENMGFGNACNQALNIIDTEFALLFNPDATIDSDGINTLIENFIAYPNAAIIAPVLNGPSHHPSTRIFRPPAIGNKKTDAVTTRTHDNVFFAEFVSGAVAMWRMQYMKKVGFFDPAFFLFYEDDDIAIRTKTAGYDLLLIAGINARHNPGNSCQLTKNQENVKYRSSIWAEFYIRQKYCGRVRTYLQALVMVCKEIRYQLLCPPQCRHLDVKPWQSTLALFEVRHKAINHDPMRKAREKEHLFLVRRIESEIRLKAAMSFLCSPTKFIK